LFAVDARLFDIAVRTGVESVREQGAGEDRPEREEVKGAYRKLHN
jgi:hypothetical protein